MTCLCPQITLDPEDSSISTGAKSSTFVMYNCVRLATLFDTFQQAVEQGEHHLQPSWPLRGCSSCLEPQGFFRHNSSFPSPFQACTHLCHHPKS